MSEKIITRFAPSPTGYIHVGGVRTAIYAWAFARKHDGLFILRIEDTDKEREVAGSIEHIVESLSWLGITWDEGPGKDGPRAPYLQSERLDHYKKYAQILIDKGLAYADPYTKEELDTFRAKADEEKRPFLYRNHRPENPPAWDGTKALRFKTPEIKSYHWNDLVRGELSAGEEALDDFILIKSDGYPTYNFAHIIDDLEMGVTHIFRADEFISSTPKFLSLYEALDIKHPEFVTLPPIIGPDGKKKLSKRDGAKDILDYRAEGYLPETMLNFLAFIGWNPGGEREVYSPKELIEAFNIAQIQKAGGTFNEEKLAWLNREHLKLLPLNVITDHLRSSWPDPRPTEEMLTKLTPIVLDHITTYGDISKMIEGGELAYFVDKPSYEKEGLLCPEKLRKNSSATLADIKLFLTETETTLVGVDENSFTAENIKQALWDYATEKGRGLVLWAMRFALSGKEKSPDPFTLASILGKEETLARLKTAILKI